MSPTPPAERERLNFGGSAGRKQVESGTSFCSGAAAPAESCRISRDASIPGPVNDAPNRVCWPSEPRARWQRQRIYLPSVCKCCHYGNRVRQWAASGQRTTHCRV